MDGVRTANVMCRDESWGAMEQPLKKVPRLLEKVVSRPIQEWVTRRQNWFYLITQPNKKVMLIVHSTP